MPFYREFPPGYITEKDFQLISFLKTIHDSAIMLFLQGEIKRQLDSE